MRDDGSRLVQIRGRKVGEKTAHVRIEHDVTTLRSIDDAGTITVFRPTGELALAVDTDEHGNPLTAAIAEVWASD